ncbi:hypothetical protein QE152_g4788 [Popillia japonica]|uniref:Uncharacterized protein n=1 Tax=Popillia japonica TaxID=7064 RepID=A0AAW1MST9_POPJA
MVRISIVCSITTAATPAPPLPAPAGLTSVVGPTAPPVGCDGYGKNGAASPDRVPEAPYAAAPASWGSGPPAKREEQKLGLKCLEPVMAALNPLTMALTAPVSNKK